MPYAFLCYHNWLQLACVNCSTDSISIAFQDEASSRNADVLASTPRRIPGSPRARDPLQMQALLDKAEKEKALLLVRLAT